jgi:hypothetical protein
MKYLFEAHFSDGSVISQTPDDISTIDPTLRSTFYDVAQRLDDVVLFGLYDNDHKYVVDLRDGHFEIDGVPFSAQPVSAPTILEGGKFKLLYFRDHQQEITISADGERTAGSHYISFRFGWEYTDPHGKTHIQTLVIA